MVSKKHNRKYIPERGDIVWLSFSPTKGHEQSGRRPGLVITSKQFNAKSGIALVAPITSTVRGYGTEVTFQTNHTKGAVLVHHTKSIDWKARKAEKSDSVSTEVVGSVQDVLVSLVLSE